MFNQFNVPKLTEKLHCIVLPPVVIYGVTLWDEVQKQQYASNIGCVIARCVSNVSQLGIMKRFQFIFAT